MKKVCLLIAFCLILFATAGCGSKKPFGMTIEDMRAKVNENIKALGYDVTVPEFEMQYGEIIINGGESKVNKKDQFYVCYINENLHLSVHPPIDMSGSFMTMDSIISSNADNTEDLIAVASGIIATIDPEADIDEIMENLKMDQTNEDTKLEYSSKTKNYTYGSDTTAGRNKTFTVQQR